MDFFKIRMVLFRLVIILGLSGACYHGYWMLRPRKDHYNVQLQKMQKSIPIYHSHSVQSPLTHSSTISSRMKQLLRNITNELISLRNRTLHEILYNKSEIIKYYENSESVIVADPKLQFPDENYWISIQKMRTVKSIRHIECSMQDGSANYCGSNRVKYYKTFTTNSNCSGCDGETCAECLRTTLTRIETPLSGSYTEVHIHVIPFANVDSYGNVRTSRFVIRPRSCQEEAPSQGGVVASADEVFVTSQTWGEAVYHSVMEEIPRLVMYLHFLTLYSHIKIHVRAITPLIASHLQVLGFDPQRLVTGDYKTGVVYMPHGGGCGRIHQPSGHLLTEIYHQYINKNFNIVKQYPNRIARSVILIKRSKHGSLADHDLISTRLQRLTEQSGFTYLVYDDENLPSFNDTLVMFYKAVMIVAPHGAGLVNMMFSKPGTFIVKIQCIHRPNNCFRTLAQSQGMVYYGLLSFNNHPQCDTMSVDINELFQVIEFYLGQSQTMEEY